MGRLNFFQNRPKVKPVDVLAYLQRLELEEEIPSLSFLKKLQKAHLLNIPFENLDIHYSQKIILDYAKIFEKVVKNKRGGFCYELNGLFYHLLYHLGFNCHVISAQVKNDEEGSFGKDFDHMAIIVSLEGKDWLVDVGFGDGIISPLEISTNKVQIDYTKYWRIIVDPDEKMLLQISKDTNYFETKYRFTLDEKQLIQFLEMCEYHQYSPESTFTQKKMITKLTQDGRVTLTDRKLKINSLGETVEVPILNEDEFLSKLEHHFGISFDQLTKLEA